MLASDVVAVVAGGLAARALAGPVAPPPAVSVGYGAIVLGWMVMLRLYRSRLATDRREELARLARSGGWSLLVLGLTVAALDLAIDLRAGLAMLVTTVVAVMVEREVVRRWFARRRRAGEGLWASILVADEADGARIRTSIDADPAALHAILGQVAPTPAANPDELLTAVLALARDRSARGVVVMESSLDGQTANRLVRGLLDAGLHVDLASTLADISIERLAARSLGPSIATWIAPRPRSGWRGRAKRAFDLALTLPALIALAPLFAVVAVLVRATSPGPVFFEQRRVGRYGEPFSLLKFRSMVANAEELLPELAGGDEGAGPLFKMRADPRVTTVGRFLRRTSIDELPQLINVLRNEMSLVGPRPALRTEMVEWDAALYDRLQVKPGITGMWQVSGRSGTSFAEYTRLDLYYVHNWSMLVDLSILARTVPAVLRRDGAY